MCAAKFENDHVHKVYEEIASHFSDTRYKPWPVIEKFLMSLEAGSLVADVGCGNGKYCGVNKNVQVVGSDITRGLLEICTDRGFEAVQADGCVLPFKSASFDYAISIAVIHHFSTEERRLQALTECLRILKKGGVCLIFAWALEQESRKFEQQDVFVPWKMGQKYDKSGHVFQRYYHLFKKGELEELVAKSGMGIVKESGYDRDNWYVFIEKLE